jgi:4-azaleucine resistance transporter AzlC
MQYKNSFIYQGLVASAPIVAAYVVLGIPCGILGARAGMSIVQVALMSVLFYSGAGQYMIPNMVISGSPIASIVLSVSLVNSRQILYAASLSRYLGKVGKKLAVMFTATVTDESFGVNLSRYSSPAGWDARRATIVNVCSWLTWILATTLGAILGNIFDVPVALASFAMTSIFICLLFTQTANKGNVIAALVAALGVLICKLVGLSGPAIFIGAMLGIIAALISNRKPTGA